MPDIDTPDHPSPAPVTVAPAGSAPPSPQGLEALKKMSTTAGLGTGDYAAVSPLAVAGFVAGLLGFLALLTDFLLVIPAVAVVLGVMGVVQVRRSNGTLTWAWLGVLAIVLGGGVAGFILGGKAYRELKLGPERKQALATLDAFGKAVIAEDYPAAYQLCDPARFRARVPPAEFNGRIASPGTGVLGRLERVDWNGNLEFLAEDGTPGGASSRRAIGGALFKYRNASDPQRVEVVFCKVGDKWMIEDLPGFFPKSPGGRP